MNEDDSGNQQVKSKDEGGMTLGTNQCCDGENQTEGTEDKNGKNGQHSAEVRTNVWPRTAASRRTEDEEQIATGGCHREGDKQSEETADWTRK